MTTINIHLTFFDIDKERGACLAVFVPLKVPLRSFFSVPFRVSSRKHERRHCVVLKLVPFRVKNISCHALKTVSWKLLGVLFKIPEKNSRPLDMAVSPGMNITAVNLLARLAELEGNTARAGPFY